MAVRAAHAAAEQYRDRVESTEGTKAPPLRRDEVIFLQDAECVISSPTERESHATRIEGRMAVNGNDGTRVTHGGLEWTKSGSHNSTNEERFTAVFEAARQEALELRIHGHSPRSESPLDKWRWQIWQLRDGTLVDMSSFDETLASLDAAMDAACARAEDLSDPSRTDIRGLKQFARSMDRGLSYPWMFTGREAVIERIRSRVDGVARRHAAGVANPAAKSTMLISGIPGTGKSALLSMLERDWRGPPRGPAMSRYRHPLVVSTGHYESLDGLAALLREHVLEKAGVHDLVSGMLRGATGGSAVSSPLHEFAALRCPIVVMIDEIQFISAPMDDPGIRMLRHLHEGTHGAPIVPVFAGLANSEYRLAEIGISLDAESVVSLGVLGRDEAAESVMRFMEKLRVKGNRSFWAERIADWSAGLPIHLHNALTSLAEALVADGVCGDLHELDACAVRRRAARLIASHSRSRMSGRLGRRTKQMARIMDAIPPDGMSRSTLVNVIDEMTASGSDSEETRSPRRAKKDAARYAVAQRGHGDARDVRVFSVFPRPDGMSPSEMFEEMLRKGVIQEGSKGRFVCPPRTLQNCCVTDTGSSLHAAVLEGNVRKIATEIREGKDTNARDMYDRTPLHWAAAEDWPEVALMLLECGADPRIGDRDGMTPLDVAIEGRGETCETARILALPEVRERPDRMQDTWHDPGEDDWLVLSDYVRPFATRVGPKIAAAKTGAAGEKERKKLGSWWYRIARKESGSWESAAEGSGYRSRDAACDAAMLALKTLDAERMKGDHPVPELVPASRR